MSDEFLEDLNRFKKLESKCGNKYEAIQRLCKKSRKLGKISKGVRDSKLLSCAIRDEVPVEHKITMLQQSWSREDEILSSVSDLDVIYSVKQSVKYSTPENIQYIYLDGMKEYQMKRVRVLTNMIVRR